MGETHKTEIIIHTTETPVSWMADKPTSEKVNEVRRWHVEERGWRDIGYNFLIDRDGTVAGGRDLDDDGDFAEEIGAHTKGHNRGTIGIALIGGYGGAATDAFSDHYTPEQDHALRTLILDLQSRYGALKVSGHNQYANKACPCFYVPDWLMGQPAKPPRKSIAQSKTIQSSAVVKLASAATPVVAAAGGMPWTNLLIIAGLALIALVASGVIDVERWKKWQRGDR